MGRPVGKYGHYQTQYKIRGMREVEEEYGVCVEVILTSGTARQIQAQYGIPFGTVCRWRRRLGIRTPARVPVCYGCTRIRVGCFSREVCGGVLEVGDGWETEPASY
jgi:hypothetical protein